MELLNKEKHQHFKDELYSEFARIGQALSQPKRLELLDSFCLMGKQCRRVG